MDTSTACFLIGAVALAGAPVASATAAVELSDPPEDICYEVNPHSIPPVYVYFCPEEMRATRR